MKNFVLCVAMVLLQLSYAASVILVKIAFARGLNQFVFVAYRHTIAMFLLGPFAYVLERKRRPSLSYGVFAKIFLLSSLGTTIYFNVFYFGLAYTSPTVASSLNNVIPSLTFLMAVLLRMEKVKIRSASGQAKVLGTIICIGGSLVFTFWRGGYQLKSFVDGPLINIYSTELGSVGELRHGQENWLKGSCLILISTIAWSGWLVLQGIISKVYPAQLSLNALICFIASLQSCLLALFFARDPLLWKLEWNVQLLTIIYCGIVGTALSNFTQTWCISYKGPIFASTFTPLCAVIVAIFSAVAFAERLHLGSLVGACLIIVGLYIVLWGKRTDNFVTGNGKDNDGILLGISGTTTDDKSISRPAQVKQNAERN
ncbi:WAT1-related protein At5g64700-like [Durio zibethinus]|uniref:WAT1-related protein n=1 Tax=Durio zibethinus TaxID=66656 RepID=A0A6P5ZPN9_DURZI|nr:WAT1-related protein At5g64700-like [Durio zibethinus]